MSRKIAVFGGVVSLVGIFLLIQRSFRYQKKRPSIAAAKQAEEVEIKRCKAIAIEGTVEICVSDYESARQAVQGGANSLELCSSRVEGGITPSIGLVERCMELVKGTGVIVHVLIRPRPGDFVYSDEEFDIIQRDILAVGAVGAHGVVCGILTSEGAVDLPRMTIVRKLSQNMLLTFHRAFDLCAELEGALDCIALCQCDRLLTSGQQTSVDLAAKNGRLGEIAMHLEGRVQVVAACGITAGNVQQLIRKAFVTAIHAGSAVTAPRSNMPSSLSGSIDLVGGSACVAPEMMSYHCARADLVSELVEKAEQTWTELGMTIDIRHTPIQNNRP